MCLSACYWARLDAIFYGAKAADAAHAGFDDAFLYEEFRKEPFGALAPRDSVAGR